MTNYERIKNMSIDEMAKVINDGISSDPCDYCTHHKFVCNGTAYCVGMSGVDIIVDWLLSEEVKE